MLYTPDEYLESDNYLGKTALLMSPSITPIYENSPAFRLFAINQREGNLYNYTQYYMDLALSNGKKIERFVVLLILCYFWSKDWDWKERGRFYSLPYFIKR